jgi:hypothetical protein
MKAECVFCEVGPEMLNIRNTVMPLMPQSVNEWSTSELVNIVGNRNAVGRLELYDNKCIKI